MNDLFRCPECGCDQPAEVPECVEATDDRIGWIRLATSPLVALVIGAFVGYLFQSTALGGFIGLAVCCVLLSAYASKRVAARWVGADCARVRGVTACSFVIFASVSVVLAVVLPAALAAICLGLLAVAVDILLRTEENHVDP
jgi:hypothetical protein